jgi:pimeloyl-ACP methyl ester carboxylesterase
MKLDMISRYPETTRKPVPLLFLHGSFSDARVWDDNFLPFFAQHGYEAHAFSLRGHGRSDGLERLHSWRLADYVADLVKVAASFPVPPVLIGHSMGGMVIQKYLETHRHAAALVLMASVPPQGLMSTSMHMAMRHPFLFQQLAQLSLLGPKFGTPEILRKILFSRDMPDDKLHDYFRYMQAESQVVSMDMMAPNMLKLKPETLQIPVLALGAHHDVLVAPTFVEQTARFYKAEFHIFRDMAHAMMLDTHWLKAAEYLLAWLERISHEQPAGVAR